MIDRLKKTIGMLVAVDTVAFDGEYAGVIEDVEQTETEFGQNWSDLKQLVETQGFHVFASGDELNPSWVKGCVWFRASYPPAEPNSTLMVRYYPSGRVSLRASYRFSYHSEQKYFLSSEDLDYLSGQELHNAKTSALEDHPEISPSS